MESINFDLKNQKFHISDFPNSEKVIMLRGDKAQELADIAICRSDLLRAKEYLQACKDQKESSITQDALWKMAIISFVKCFGKNNARIFKLDISQILPGDTLGERIFIFFKDLRDKNIAHDDNPISQCLVGAIINKVDAPRKVAKIITMNLHGQIYGGDNAKNLDNIIQMSLRYAEKRYDELCKELTKELEILPHAQLIKLETLRYKTPMVNEFSKNRKKLIKK